MIKILKVVYAQIDSFLMKDRGLILIALLILGKTAVLAETFDSLKDPDVLYFSGKSNEVPHVIIERMTPLFTEKDLRSLLRNLPAGTQVQVMGWHSRGWLIQSLDASNSWEGWVSSEVIRSISEKELQKYRERNEAIRAVEVAIQEKMVLPGMSEEEVRKVLGKPKESSFRVDEKGKRMIWSYIRYEEIPELRSVRDTYGRLMQITTMIRVPRGERRVEFKEGKVVAYEEKKVE